MKTNHWKLTYMLNWEILILFKVTVGMELTIDNWFTVQTGDWIGPAVNGGGVKNVGTWYNRPWEGKLYYRITS